MPPDHPRAATEVPRHSGHLQHSPHHRRKAYRRSGRETRRYSSRNRGQARPTTDVQGALSVLGRLPQRPDVSRGDLTDAEVAGANLDFANLTRALLSGVNLTGAVLIRADLTGALLIRADLTGAHLEEANLTGASLDRANLTGTVLFYANLTGASLDRADLTGALLHGANLGQARELTQPQLNVARGNAETQLPAGLERPASWAAAAPPIPLAPPPTTG